MKEDDFSIYQINILEHMKERSIIDIIDKCWLFKGTKNKDGYGMIRYKGKMVSVHRLSAHLHLDLDMEDKQKHALHKCSAKNCWNPEHLYIGTNTDNQQDSIFIGTMHKGNQHTNQEFCKRGHSLEDAYITRLGRRKCRICEHLRYKHEI